MKHYGFKDSWTLAGLKNYFEKHSQQPVNQLRSALYRIAVATSINHAEKRFLRATSACALGAYGADNQ